MPLKFMNCDKDKLWLHLLLIATCLALVTILIMMSENSPANAASTAASSMPLTLWYVQPAGSGMNEALPIGNGRMGGLVYGGTANDQIVFNEDSLWTGDSNPSGDYGSMGSYQKFGEIDVALPGQDEATGYRRNLDLNTATAHVTYHANGATFRREYFASHPAQVLVARFTADKPAAYTGSITMPGAHNEVTKVNGGRLSFSGTLPNQIGYEAQLQVIADGGTIKADGSTLTFAHCNSITLVLGTGTTYVMDYARNYHGADPHAGITEQIDTAARTPYETLKRDHIADYRKLFDRVQLSLGTSPVGRDALPTDARKILASQGDDPEMEQLLFQYGRYLLISCSRPGSLPANLQGLWNDSNSPPWSSDYHTDINIQMNYWPAEVANLAECHLPLFDLTESQIPAWAVATQAAPEYKTTNGTFEHGFDLRTSHNITGGLGWLWLKTSNAWYCRHYWEHYAFTGDKVFLRKRAYPILKLTSEFWEHHLKTLPDGRLAVPDGWSPEHGNFEDGVSFNQELVWDLFTNTMEAAKTLDTDPEFRAQLAAERDKLVEPKIGRWGQLQEWMEDKDDPNDHHRHTSHLVGVYPGRQFSPHGTPAMMAAAKTSLLHRGNDGDVTEWAFAWRTALFARMLDASRAYGQLIQFFAARNSCVNLFGFCPPMQIDGDFGMTAAMCEMLLQSQNDEIDLLPALPPAWHTGSVRGLCARGGFVIDEAWQNGKLSHVTVHNVTGTHCSVRYRNSVVVLQMTPGQSITLNGTLKDVS